MSDENSYNKFRKPSYSSPELNKLGSLQKIVRGNQPNLDTDTEGGGNS